MRPRRVILSMIEPPDPFGNPAARWFYVLLKGLVERGHDVTAFATCSRRAEAERARELFPSPAYDLRCYTHSERKGVATKLETLRRPYSYLFGEDLRRDLETELGRGFDVLHLEQLWSGWLGLAHASRAVVNIHYLFEIDLADQPRGSLAERALFNLTCRAERRLLRHYPNICTLSPRLSARVAEISPRSTVHTVPLGIDSSLYPFGEPRPEGREPVVSLIGSFNWQPTYSAGARLMTRLWPEIKRQVPDARLQIVGRKARAKFGDYAGLPDVAIHEDVPDINPYFANTDVLLYAPGRGSGMKVKVLEAFALGTPVVTTGEGVEGIPARDGVHAGVCEDDRGLVERTVALLRDRGRARGQRVAARSLLESHCSPRATLDLVEGVYKTICG